MKEPIRRRSLAAAGSGVLGAPPAGRAFAQEAYPSRPVTLVVPWAAGGSTDAVARVLAARLSSDVGRPFVVDNRTGANGTIGFGSWRGPSRTATRSWSARSTPTRWRRTSTRCPTTMRAPSPASA